MAVNVYMIFFMAYHPSHRHMWFYCIICFGVPAIPATICLLYSPNGSKIYGDATVSRHSSFPIYINRQLRLTTDPRCGAGLMTNTAP